MLLIYNVFVRLYYFIILLLSLFNNKARLWINGRKNFFANLKQNNLKTNKWIWFHISSLGEFEQARPLIEKIKIDNKKFKILISFFSPSGFEIRKNYEYADFICYLPIDTKKNARKFINSFNIKKVFWVKYDFWYHYLKQLDKQKIPTYLISAKFRDNQIFFKHYGKFFRKILKFFTFIYVQDADSEKLLKKSKFKNVIVAGDTRIDRVYQLSKTAKNIDVIEKFKANKLLFVIGSSWKEDEDEILKFMQTIDLKKMKFIIAPHNTEKQNIQRVSKLFAQFSQIKFSHIEQKEITNNDILIIDNIGMLSSLYQYADFTYIGGGFGRGLHNILEPASFGMPIFFGNCYHKFNEATELIKQKICFSINNSEELSNKFNKINNTKSRAEIKQLSKEYIKQNSGGTEKIYLSTI